MVEKTLALPLSGDEVVKAILDKIEEKLRRDCYLHPNSAYDFFTAHVSLNLLLNDAGQEYTVEQEVNATYGPAPEEEGEPTQVDVDIEKAPPNQVRVETGQPVPVMTKTPEGRPTVKGIRYARNRAKVQSA